MFPETPLLSPILNRHRLPVAQANGTLILDRPVYGDDVLVTTQQTLDEKPLALTAFVAGTVDALQRLLEPASDGQLYQAAEAAGMTITDPIRAGWANDLQDFVFVPNADTSNIQYSGTLRIVPLEIGGTVQEIIQTAFSFPLDGAPVRGTTTPRKAATVAKEAA